jgi:hypothetical protein
MSTSSGRDGRPLDVALPVLEVDDMQPARSRLLFVFGAAGVVLGVGVLGFSALGATTSTSSDEVRSEQFAAASHPRPNELLPDLDQEAPSELALRVGTRSDGRPTYELGFRSAVVNVGKGPLLLIGERPGIGTPRMTVDQYVERVRARPRVVHGVGWMQYVVSPTHRHWHYLQFDRYVLQSAQLVRAGGGIVVADRKTGFCLGDRFRTTQPTAARAPRGAVYRSRCGLEQPQRLRIREGISVGYGDDYSGFVEGQQLPLDGLPDGRYVLVHRVNSNGHLRELSYDNNAASVLIDLRWRAGAPVMRVLGVCPGTDRCDARHFATRVSQGE